MGQYYLITNLDKKEYMCHHDFGSGIKLCEHRGMILDCLVALLAESNGRGGGDIQSNHPIIGSWAGDRIMFAGDYADPNAEFGKPTPVWNEEKKSWENGPAEFNVYQLTCEENWKNISLDIFIGMMEDPWFQERFKENYIDGDTWYRHWSIPDVMVSLAYALKNIETAPDLGNKAAWVFRTLFGDGTSEYYRAMHGLIKHHDKPYIYKKALERELSF